MVRGFLMVRTQLSFAQGHSSFQVLRGEPELTHETAGLGNRRPNRCLDQRLITKPVAYFGRSPAKRLPHGKVRVSVRR